MCLSAIYWARIERFFYANTRENAAAIDFDDALIYRELDLPLEQRQIPAEQLLTEEALAAFQEWKSMSEKTVY